MKSPESQLQSACVMWFRLQYPVLGRLMFAVPNGHYRSKRTACIIKGEGVVAGVADLILLVPNKKYASLCIEMKAGKGRQTELQAQFQSAAESVGNMYAVCRTFEEFQTTVNQYVHAR
jgi:hypothetical protein